MGSSDKGWAMEKAMMSKEFPLWRKVDVLFRWGEEQGLNVTYKAIAEATGETWTNLNKIRRGDNPNPGLRTVEAMARYFGVKLDYFNCESEAECWTYLKELSEEGIRELARMRARAHNVSPEALVTLKEMIDKVLEFVDQVEHPDGEQEN